MRENVNRAHLNMPREWVFLNRLQWGLYSILAILNAEVDVSKIVVELLQNEGLE
jgi:hypothetical protein